MAYLVDTGVLLRAFDATSNHYRPIRRALRRLMDDGERVVVGIQNIAEFWNVATRPLKENGYGLSAARAQLRVELIERFCEVLSETSQSYGLWKGLLTRFGVSGVAVHDARLVAIMQAHGISRIVTLNAGDFERYRTEEIEVLTPDAVVAG